MAFYFLVYKTDDLDFWDFRKNEMKFEILKLITGNLQKDASWCTENTLIIQIYKDQF
jgi:hypothetical protein